MSPRRRCPLVTLCCCFVATSLMIFLHFDMSLMMLMEFYHAEDEGRILSFQRLILPSSPALHPKLLIMIGMVALHNEHIFEPFPSYQTFSMHIILFLWKYLFKKAIFHSSLESNINFQTILAPTARFMYKGS